MVPTPSHVVMKLLLSFPLEVWSKKDLEVALRIQQDGAFEIGISSLLMKGLVKEISMRRSVGIISCRI